MADDPRVFLDLPHALLARRKVHSVLFGTRLASIGRALADEDVDEALACCGGAASDLWDPLLRHDAFESKGSGIEAMLPHVDEYRPIHNLNAAADLCRALTGTRSGEAGPRAWPAASA